MILILGKTLPLKNMPLRNVHTRLYGVVGQNTIEFIKTYCDRLDYKNKKYISYSSVYTVEVVHIFVRSGHIL